MMMSAGNGGRSSLEEMLEMIKRRDEKPKDVPPALPVRPLSKARLPSARRSLPINFKVTGQEYLLLGDFNVKKKRDRILSVDQEDLLGSQTNNKIPKVVPIIVESTNLASDEQIVQSPDLSDIASPLEVSRPTGRVDFLLIKEFQVWCYLPTGQWQSGKIESVSNTDAVVILSNGNVATVSRENILPANPDVVQDVDDLIRLSFLNEPSVLHNLHIRYQANKFYTKAGRILVAMNPFNDIQFHQKELLDQKKLMGPHVYATAEFAFTEMMRDEENQSIILSGESGAGKTEIANVAAKYLAALGGSSELEDKIDQTNRILEAFGNAKTSMNPNSSRFGKMIEIQFSVVGKVCGAKFGTSMLEKSRVVQPAEGERSYHVFYQLCSGASSSLKEKLHLKNPGEYEYLKQSNCLTIDGADDAGRFHLLTEALDLVQISREEQENAFAIVSAVLWLGNISFRTINNESHVEVIDDEAVANASKLLGCNVHDLLITLSSSNVQSSTDNIVQRLTLRQAIDTRDALAKYIYASLFDWLLEKINKSLQIDKESAWRSITIIDICGGFESYQKNGFEHLCVNYVNEKLHQHFNRHVFQLDQEEYTREGIDWTQVDFEDNQECVDLFEQKPCGLLHLLDEESNNAEATDLTLSNKLKHHSSSNPFFKENKDGTFSVRHYAGEVLYDTSGFLENNRDSLHSGSVQLLSSCTYQLPQLFASKMLRPKQNPSSPLRATGSQKGNVETTLKDQLSKLMQQLQNTEPHFICCIKPNNKQHSGLFEKHLVLRQLRSCRVLEAARISRLGYPTRMTHQQFARRYGLLSMSNLVSQEPLNTSITILEQFNIHPDAYQVGYTKLFFRTGQVAILEDARKRIMWCIIKVQKCFRGHLARRDFLELAKRSFLTKRSRKSFSSPTYDEQRAIILLQSVTRGWLVRKQLHVIRNLHRQKVVAQLESSLKRKEDENAALQQQLKQIQLRWAENDARMKTMEETWQKQMTALQMNLAAARKNSAVPDPTGPNGRYDTISLPNNYSDSECSVSAPRTPERQTPARLHHHKSNTTTPSREANGSLNPVSYLAAELEQRKQVFNNDVKILVEVKSGQSGSGRYSYDDLRKVKRNFEAWKKEFKDKIRETKKLLKRGSSESDNKSRGWWGKRSSKNR
ncbi:hypothetical protein ACHQM5_002919 [Ranunculus cassubicifolius]